MNRDIKITRALLECIQYDNELTNEIEKWPQGFTIFIGAFPDRPLTGLRKGSSGLQAINTASIPSDYNSLILFKTPENARLVFKGKISVHQAFLQRRFLYIGDRTAESSVIKVMTLLESLKKHHRIKVYLRAFFMKMREVESFDSEVLRVFE